MGGLQETGKTCEFAAGDRVLVLLNGGMHVGTSDAAQLQKEKQRHKREYAAIQMEGLRSGFEAYRVSNRSVKN